MALWLSTYGFLLVSMLLAALLGLAVYVPLMAGQLSLAGPGFYALGGYIAAIVSTQVWPAADGTCSLWLVGLEMLMAGVVSGLLAVLVGIPALRLRGIYLALATIAFVEILRVLALNLTITGGAIGIFNIPQPFASKAAYLWLVTPILLLTTLAVARLEHTPVGRAFLAIREDELAAAAMGIHTTVYKVLAFALGAGLAGMVGAISAHFLNTWNARQGTFDASVQYLAFVLIGGSRTSLGPVVGGLALTALPEVLRLGADAGGAALPAWFTQVLQESRQVVYGALLAIGAIFFPQGLITPALLQVFRPRPIPRSGQAVLAQPLTRLRSQLPASQPLLEAREMTCRFGGLLAVNAVSFQVQPGEIFGLIGPNGAGKTTLFNLITGLTTPASGALYYQGAEITGQRPHQIARHGIARTFQNIRLFGNLSAVDNVLIAQHLHTQRGALASVLGLPGAQREERRTRQQAMALLELVGLEARANLQAQHLAYGDQRRLEIARALAVRPRLLLLDEPAAGMNSGEKQTLSALIRQIRAQFDLTIVLIEHHVPLVMGLCDRVAVLNFGHLLALDTPAHVQHDQAVIEAYLGEES